MAYYGLVTFSGRVVDGQENPVPYAEFGAVTQDANIGRRGYSDANGYYSFSLVSEAGNELTWVKISVGVQGPIIERTERLYITSTNHDFTINFSLQLEKIKISGAVRDQYGSAVSDAKLELYASPETGDAFGVKLSETTTGGDGKYTLEANKSTYVAVRLVTGSISGYLSSSLVERKYRPIYVDSYNQDYAVTLSSSTATPKTTVSEYCLTSTVAFGVGGSVRIQIGSSSYCSANGVSPTISCAQNYSVGSIIPCTALVDSGWQVHKWELRSANSLTSGTILASQTGGTTFNVTMPAQNAYLFLYFKKPSVFVNLLVAGAVNGLVDLYNPSGLTTGPDETMGLAVPYGTGLADAIAYPSNGYQVQKWTVNGVEQSSTSNILQFSLDTNPVTVIVYMEPVTACDTYSLTVNVEGRGSVYPSSGDYCQDSTQILTPRPAGSYRFKGWEYNTNDSAIVPSGITLRVTMNGAKTVKAIFESVGIVTGTTPISPNVFYCPSEDYRSHVVAFDYTNDNNPSYSATFHFRVNFYSDASKTNLVYTAFSLVDSKRWYYDDGAIRQFPSTGVSLSEGQIVRVIYDPEILPISLLESQAEESIHGANLAATEIPLACGAQYFVDIQALAAGVAEVTGDDVLEFVSSLSMTVDCDDVGSFHWDRDIDTNNWLCSGQGKVDLKVSDSSDQSVYSDVGANVFGLFRVAWQGKRGSTNSIYGATWDSENDILFGSGQGLFDKRYLAQGFRPSVLTDQANNFYLAAHHKTDVGYYACPEEIFIESTTTETEDSSFAEVCYPGASSYLGTSFTDMKVRLSEVDQEGSLTISKDKAIPVVTKQNIHLDISGINGAYAIRLRNAEDADWGAWMVVDDSSKGIVKVDNSRFIVPWQLDRINGVRRVCCRVLALYGISRTFCTEIFFNKPIVEYVFRFYADSQRESTSQVSSYNGMPVLAEGTCYFSVIFSEEVSYSSLTFNVIQQGINEVYGLTLTRVDGTRFDGEFEVHKHDGVFNQDGKAFIQVVFPDQVSTSSCGSDTNDIYNLATNNVDAERYQNLGPEEVYHEVITSKINKAANLQPFKQYYDTDDNNFKFGSPDYFRND